MARRNKRASMREGPLSDLFRSTSEDAPVDPPEAPRYGREDPAEAKKAAGRGRSGRGSCRRRAHLLLRGGRGPPSTPPAAEAAVRATFRFSRRRRRALYDQEIEELDRVRS